MMSLSSIGATTRSQYPLQYQSTDLDDVQANRDYAMHNRRTMPNSSYDSDRSQTSEDATNGAKGIATRSKNATRGSWPYY